MTCHSMPIRHVTVFAAAPDLHSSAVMAVVVAEHQVLGADGVEAQPPQLFEDVHAKVRASEADLVALVDAHDQIRKTDRLLRCGGRRDRRRPGRRRCGRRSGRGSPRGRGRRWLSSKR